MMMIVMMVMMMVMMMMMMVMMMMMMMMMIKTCLGILIWKTVLIQILKEKQNLSNHINCANTNMYIYFLTCVLSTCKYQSHRKQDFWEWHFELFMSEKIDHIKRLRYIFQFVYMLHIQVYQKKTEDILCTHNSTFFKFEIFSWNFTLCPLRRLCLYM